MNSYFCSSGPLRCLVLLAAAQLLLVMELCSLKALAFDLSIYPEPSDDEQVFVIELPQSADDDVLVEVMPGKTLSFDCTGEGTLSAQVDKAYVVDARSYYKVTNFTENPPPTPAGGNRTKRACPVRHDFVPASGASVTTPYDSPAPVVVYAPADAEVQYRVWTANSWEGANTSSKVGLKNLTEQSE